MIFAVGTRGPVLFGRGVAAMGGEFRLEPNVPKFHHEGKLTVETGDYGSWRAGITENLVLIPDKLALRLNAVGEGTDGGHEPPRRQRTLRRNPAQHLP